MKDGAHGPRGLAAHLDKVVVHVGRKAHGIERPLGLRRRRGQRRREAARRQKQCGTEAGGERTADHASESTSKNGGPMAAVFVTVSGPYSPAAGAAACSSRGLLEMSSPVA